MVPLYRPTRAIVSLDAWRRNVQAYRRALPADIRIMAVVKANAYGHGSVELAKEAAACGVDAFGVASLDEAIELRAAGVVGVPILVLGYTPPHGLDAAREYDVSLTVYSEEVLDALEQTSEHPLPLKIHIKIDTGMGRIGLRDEREAVRFIDRALALNNVSVEGLFTHFARADEADKAPTREQYLRMKRIIDHYAAQGIRFPYVHAGNSAAAIDTPEFCFNMVRLGIGLYGLYPSREVNRERVLLEPVMSLVTQVVMVKTVPAGTPISYGGVYTTGGEERIATLPVGYGDGYSRRLSGAAHVLIRGRKVPVVGTICMDQCMVNVTGMDVRQGDEAVLIGRQGGQTISADDLANWSGTISYEITTAISGRVPKVYIREGRMVSVSHPRLSHFSSGGGEPK